MLETISRTAGDIDPDEAIVAADPLCRQALEAQAEDMAVEDTLYALERSFQSGGLPADVYLKQVWTSAQRIGSHQHSSIHRLCCPAGGSRCLPTDVRPQVVQLLVLATAGGSAQPSLSGLSSLASSARRLLVLLQPVCNQHMVWPAWWHLHVSACLQVRMLCGKQFYVRALGMKIAALQHRHGPPQPPPPPSSDMRQAAPPQAAGSAGRPVQMHLGDSWTSTGIVSNPLV
jgi:Vps23 core domain